MGPLLCRGGQAGPGIYRTGDEVDSWPGQWQGRGGRTAAATGLTEGQMAIPTMGLLSGSPPADPKNPASPKLKIPPSDATCQYPLSLRAVVVVEPATVPDPIPPGPAPAAWASAQV